jgi:diaminopimelate epimerase
MTLIFYKYQGTGNDFIMINNFDGAWNELSISTIQQLCDRKFGIGADGLIKINQHPEFDFEMDYYNADGSKSFCGNGARCSVAFAQKLGIISQETSFLAIDGKHEASLNDAVISLRMNDVSSIQVENSDFILNTGSPHYIRYVSHVKNENMHEIGKNIRYSERFLKEGINVNLVEEVSPKQISVRTYERGVESETLSCGTGVTAAVLATAHKNSYTGEQKLNVETLGGNLSVSFQFDSNSFTEIYLEGPALFVFKGEVNV